MPKPIDFRPVILAGGSGTRFWPRSRRARAKQVLALDGERSMIQQTVSASSRWPRLEQDLGHHQRVPRPGDRRPVAGRARRTRSSRSRWPATPRPPAAWPRSSLSARIPMRCWASFPPITSSPTSRASSRRCRRASPWPPPATTWWCWASSLPAPKPATATSRPATTPATTSLCTSAALPRNPT